MGCHLHHDPERVRNGYAGRILVTQPGPRLEPVHQAAGLRQQAQRDPGPVALAGEELDSGLAAGILEPARAAGHRQLERVGRLNPGGVDLTLLQHQRRMILTGISPEEDDRHPPMPNQLRRVRGAEDRLAQDDLIADGRPWLMPDIDEG